MTNEPEALTTVLTPYKLCVVCRECDQVDYALTRRELVNSGWKHLSKDTVNAPRVYWTHIGTCPDCTLDAEPLNRPPARTRGLFDDD